MSFPSEPRVMYYYNIMVLGRLVQWAHVTRGTSIKPVDPTGHAAVWDRGIEIRVSRSDQGVQRK